MNRRKFIKTATGVLIPSAALASAPLPLGFWKPASSGANVDSEVLDWVARVVAGGGTVSGTTQTAADTLMKAIKAAGLRSKILRMGIYAGDTKACCAFPFIKDIGGTTESFSGAISSGTWTYSETGAGGGLASSGGDILDTGVAANNASMGLEDYHMGVYKTTKVTGGIPMGAGTSGTGVGAFSFNAAGNVMHYFMFSATGDITNVSDTGQIGYYVEARNGTLTGYKNGSSAGTNASPGGARSTGNIYVHNASLNGGPWGGGADQATLACYHLGTFLTSSDVTALYNAVQAFQTTLTRNV